METMTVKELIEALKEYDENMPVMISPFILDIQEGVIENKVFNYLIIK